MNLTERPKKHVLVVGMTNMIDAIDPAIRRRGRFDHIIEVGMPSTIEIQQVIESSLAELPHQEDIDITSLAAKMTGSPMSDVAFILREAARLTAKNHMKIITQDIIDMTAEKVLAACVTNNRTIGFHE